MVATIETQLLKVQRLGIFRMFSRKQDIYITPLPTVKELTGSVSEWEGEQGQREKVISGLDRIFSLHELTRLTAQDLYKIKPDSVPAWNRCVCVFRTPISNLVEIDGYLGNKSPFSLRIWLLVDPSLFSGLTHSHEYMGNINLAPNY